MWTNFLDFFSTPSETGDDDSLFDEVPEVVSEPTPTETPSDVDVTSMVPPMATLPEGEGMDFIGDVDTLGGQTPEIETTKDEERQKEIKIQISSDLKKQNLPPQEYEKELSARVASGASGFEKGVKLRDTAPSVLALSKLIIDSIPKLNKETKAAARDFITSAYRPTQTGNLGAHQHKKAVDIRSWDLHKPGVAEKVYKFIKRTLVNAGYKFVKPTNDKGYILKAGIETLADGKTRPIPEAQLWFMFIKDNESFMIELEKLPKPHIHIQSGSDYATTRGMLTQYKNKQSNTE